MSALFEVTNSIQSISLLILAPNEKKNVVKSLLSHQLSLVSLTGPTVHIGTVGICAQLYLTDIIIIQKLWVAFSEFRTRAFSIV